MIKFEPIVVKALNLSIFQPAIDITDHALGKGKTDLLSFIGALQHQQAEDANEQDVS